MVGIYGGADSPDHLLGHLRGSPPRGDLAGRLPFLVDLTRVAVVRNPQILVTSRTSLEPEIELNLDDLWEPESLDSLSFDADRQADF